MPAPTHRQSMETTPRQVFAFVIMPFSNEWRDTYELGIKPACEAAGVQCARVDEQIFLESILERIYGEIERADLVISEMTGRNPNVFYETGFAHGLGKPVLLLTRTADDIPFDLRHHPHIVHGGSISRLKDELYKRVRWIVDNPEDAIRASRRQPPVPPLERAAQHITNYLRENKFTSVSFQRVRENINSAYTDELLLQLIDESPQRFRRAKIKGGFPGIGLVSRDEG